MGDESDQNSHLGQTLSSLPMFILLGALFVAVLWWIEPVRYHVFRATIDVHPVVAKRALEDDSDRIVSLACQHWEIEERPDACFEALRET